MLKPQTRLSHPSFSFSIVSLFMADESGTFHQKCALWIATSQNCPIFFINNLKTAFCPCHSFFSLPSALNYSFSPVQNLYRFEFIVFKKVLWLNVLGYIKRLPHQQRGAPAMGTGYRHRYGRYRKLLRGFVRICRRQVYQLHRGATHHDESLQYPSRGA